MGQNREVRPYIPKPLQCMKCSRYGHSDTKCRNIAVCAYCSSDRHPTKWECGAPLCVNCKSHHHARTKTCPHYIYNTELKLLMLRTGLPVREAKLELKMRGILDPAKKKQFNTVTTTNTIKSSSENASKLCKEQSVVPRNRDESRQAAEPNTSDNNSKSQSKPGNRGKELTMEVEPDLQQKTNISESQANKTESEKPLSQDHESIIDINPFEILSTVNQNFDIDEDVKDIDNKEGKDSKKRERENDNSPKRNRNKKSKTIEADKQNPSVKSKICNAALMNTSIEDIEPSPIIKTSILPPKKDTINFASRTHASNCGCSNCFEYECRKFSSLNKDNLLNTVKHFMNNRKEGVTEDLSIHPAECMCVKHLTTYYRKSPTNIDSYLEKFNSKYQSKPLLENQDSKNDNTGQKTSIGSSKNKTRYSRISTKTASSINLQNLTTLT